jgi:hypothetical protein
VLPLLADNRAKTHPRPGRAGFASVLAGALALVAGGCGGGSPKAGVASLGKTTTTQSAAPAATNSSGGGGSAPAGNGSGSPHGQVNSSMAVGSYADALKFAQCMRSHGVPNFPDPGSGGAIQFGSGDGINPRPPQFQKAQNACKKFLPNKGAPPSPTQQAKMLAQALKFSECTRAHGITDFPDPQATGGGIRISISSGSGSNLNPKDPQFQTAQKACQSLMPGPKGGGHKQLPG